MPVPSVTPVPYEITVMKYLLLGTPYSPFSWIAQSAGADAFVDVCESTPPDSLKSDHALKCGVALCTSTAAASLYTYERERAR